MEAELQLEKWKARNARRIARRENKARAIQAWNENLDREFGVRPNRGGFEAMFNYGPGVCPF